MHTYQGREGELRIYDLNNNFVKVKFEQMDLSAPIARPRTPDPITVHAHGFSHNPTGGDYDSGFYEPLTLDFSCSVTSADFWKLRDALSNASDRQPWKVGNTAWTTTKGRGSIIQPDLTFIPTPAFFDQRKVTVKFESLWTSPHSGSVVGQYWDEVFIPPQNITLNESADMVDFRVQGLVYGNMGVLGAFTAGTES